jgi:hypothetical protein
MTITIPIPEDLERTLRAQTPDLDSAASVALLVSLYRRGQLTTKQLADGLGLNR